MLIAISSQILTVEVRMQTLCDAMDVTGVPRLDASDAVRIPHHENGRSEQGSVSRSAALGRAVDRGFGLGFDECMMTIVPADFDDPQLADFLQQHLDDMAPTAPAEARHALDLSALQGDEVRLWVAYDGSTVVGTVALAQLLPRHEELKSMRTSPEHRGQGIASQLLDHVLADARSRGIERISLETGSMEFFAPARAFYRKAGFAEVAPFGTYVPDPNSVFMTLML
ncbi:GNAT family N-acetyltransferase [Brevibacterium casei]|uniref:GNAT family N-acetyltransferase n=1 Tax=Brevibacterium casei TaxID=33889 RepID=UPI0028D1E879|nr:GNAT family N-acetyltransferase [Brevibacterium casei]